MKTPSRWPLVSREDYEEFYSRDMVSSVYPDELVLPILADAIDNLPNSVRLVAGGMHLTLELLSQTEESIILCTLPSHIREKVIDRFRMIATAYKHPFTIKQDGIIFATYKGSNYDIAVNYSTQFYGRDEILTFRAREANDEPVSTVRS